VHPGLGRKAWEKANELKALAAAKNN